MDTERLRSKVETLRLLPPGVLTGQVADAALRSFVTVLENSANPEVCDEAGRLHVIESMRAMLSSIPLPPEDDGLADDTKVAFCQSLENMLNSAADETARELCVQSLVDMALCEVHPNRVAVAAVVSSYVGSAPSTQLLQLVDYLGGAMMPEFPDSFEQFCQRCAGDADLLRQVAKAEPEAGRMAWLTTMLPRCPEDVLDAASKLSLDATETESLCKTALDQVVNRDLPTQVGLLERVAGLLKRGMFDAVAGYFEGLARLLTSGDESIEADGLRLLHERPKLLGTAHSRALAERTVDWFTSPSLADKGHSAAVDAIVEMHEHLTPEELSRLIGILFDNSVKAENRPGVIEHALASLSALGVKYSDRPANFEDVRRKYDQESRPEVRAALDRGLAALHPPNMRLNASAKTFWKWVDSRLAGLEE